ncbi:hypothetical protein Are01nite_88340 [Actinoplanes regularis]|nr:hypothetical protein Are01nite_88340 [Actinoplanes regularis]
MTACGPKPRQRKASGSGSPLCQDTVESEVLDLLSAGSGSDFSEEPAWGCELVTLEFADVPCVLPNPSLPSL